MVDDWFWGWVGEHLARHPHAMLPPITSEEAEALYGAWRKVFVTRGIHDLDVATEASELLSGEVIRGPREHFPKLVELAIGLYKARGRQPGDGRKAGREEAAAASKHCPFCYGSGLATVWHPRPVAALKIPESASAYCVCSLGQWTAETHKEKSPEIFKQTPKLRDVLDGLSEWLPEQPSWPDLETRRRAIFGPAACVRDGSGRWVPNPELQQIAAVAGAPPEAVSSDPILAGEAARRAARGPSIVVDTGVIESSVEPPF